jgi:uncharacterized membrane protein YhaH (DUF805 family)
VGRRRGREPLRDISSPDVPRRLDDSIRARRRRYFWLMGPCLVLVVFGFFVPAPTAWRIAALAVAAVIPPIAAVVANVGRR